MNCTNPHCGKSWNPGDVFPLCITNPCPLRAYRNQHEERTMGKPIFSASSPSSWHQCASVHAAEVSNSFDALRGPLSMEKYDMQGAKSATTKVVLRNKQERIFRTTDQMHSEMCAIDRMLAEGHWTIYLGQIVWSDGQSITGEQFSTTEPHCGFCTLFLMVLGLPLTRPTYGNYQLASRLSYQLPVPLEINPWFLARVLDSGCYCGFHMIKRVMNSFVNVPSDKWVLNIKNLAWVNDHGYVTFNPVLFQITWDDLENDRKREVIWAIWKFVFETLLNSNKEHRK